jgi:hypothetical protein
MHLNSCVTPNGRFIYGVHKPHFKSDNLRQDDHLCRLGKHADGRLVENRSNFPEGTVAEDDGDWIYEIANPFPFRGTSYIARSWADEKARDPSTIRLPQPPPVSFSRTAAGWIGPDGPGTRSMSEVFDTLPGPLKIALATSSTDPEDLVRLAQGCTEFVRNPVSGKPAGLVYETDPSGRSRPKISDHLLFEAVANNRHLPDDYKKVMVLRPGVQGGSEIVGDLGHGPDDTHVFEYLRRNSYIPWGHYAANMADDMVRYRIADLTAADLSGMRHLYYQRTYARLAGLLGVRLPAARRPFSSQELEDLRCRVADRLGMHAGTVPLPFNATLWGWNFGFDFSPSAYRLNASHQQIHQQFAMVPAEVSVAGSNLPADDMPASLPSYAVGDLVAAFAADFQERSGRPFFEAYLEAIRTNRRMDGRDDRDSRLTIFEDDRILLFVPKAQTSQWEIQLMCRRPVGNVLEADAPTRRAIDRGIRTAVSLLSAMGAKMITAFEASKRFDVLDTDQRLLYVFLPRIPQSPGGFSEHQLRWITGHYPEDFAAACRAAMATAKGT